MAAEMQRIEFMSVTEKNGLRDQSLSDFHELTYYQYEVSLCLHYTVSLILSVDFTLSIFLNTPECICPNVSDFSCYYTFELYFILF